MRCGGLRWGRWRRFARGRFVDRHRLGEQLRVRDHDHVAPDLPLPQLVAGESGDETGGDYERKEDDKAGGDETEIVDRPAGRKLEAASRGGRDHSSVSASSAAGASPSAATSPSAGTAASAAGSSSSTLSSRLCTILTISSSGSSSTVTPPGTLRSDTRSSASISSSGVMSTWNASGISEGKHSTRTECMG